jgi:hypothetical protein
VGGHAGFFWNGTIDDARMYDFVLSEAQIAAMYDSGACDNNLIVADETELGDQWQAMVTPFSSTEAGTTVASNILTIEELIGNADIEEPALPSLTRLVGAQPNPFNPTTSVAYDLHDAGYVSIQVFDLKGRLVQTLVDEMKSAGSHVAVWNGRDAYGRAAGTGVYFVKMQSGEYRSTAKMVLIK